VCAGQRLAPAAPQLPRGRNSTTDTVQLPINSGYPKLRAASRRTIAQMNCPAPIGKAKRF